jgi:hypothetical protein
MDPATGATTVLGILTAALAVCQKLHQLRDKLAHADLTISSILAESSVVNAALSQLQSIFATRQKHIAALFRDSAQLSASCDLVLTTCGLVYSRLAAEVGSLEDAIRRAGGLTLVDKVRVAWKQGNMQELLLQIRGQATGLNLLLQCFHM